MSRDRVVLVEDNQIFRETLELLLGLRGDIEVVGSVESGARGGRGLRERRPGRRARRLPDARAGRRADDDGDARGLARARVDLPDRLGLGRRGAELVLAAGAVACVTKDEELDRIVEAIHGSRADAA